jgi:dTDP-4-dehydrorhamnose reductase
MRIGITGASGMLGGVLATHLSKTHEIFATSRSKGVENKNIKWNCFDLTDIVLLNKWLEKTKPDMVIHCAAIINVDLCEESFDLAMQLHFETTKVIASYLGRNNGKLIYISTDSVFDGEKQGAYSESDLVEPLNIYVQWPNFKNKYNWVDERRQYFIRRMDVKGADQQHTIKFVL